MIACCGLTCTECPAYLATRRDDNSERIKVAELWSRELKADIKPGDINCDGCLSESGKLFSHCSVCKIRKCAIDRRIENCAHCGEFPCRSLSFITDAVPAAKKALEEIRKDL